MRPTQKTIALLVVFLAFLALNFVDVGTGYRLSEQLPTLPALDRKTVDRIELSSATSKIILAGSDEDSTFGATMKVWRLRAPIEGDADQIAVRTLLSQFRKEIPLDAKVDAGNLEEYGLDAGNGLVVEMFEGSDEPSVSFTMGKEGPGGSTFIRLSGDDAIYRARLGGRHRYDKPPTDWRNKVVMGFQEPDADRVTVYRNGSATPSIELVRAPPREERGRPLGLSPDPGWPTDQEVVVGMVKSLGTFRTSQIMDEQFDAGFDPPAVRLPCGSPTAASASSKWASARSTRPPLLGAPVSRRCCVCRPDRSSASSAGRSTTATAPCLRSAAPTSTPSPGKGARAGAASAGSRHQPLERARTAKHRSRRQVHLLRRQHDGAASRGRSQTYPLPRPGLTSRGPW